jgi:hypothetical protein
VTDDPRTAQFRLLYRTLRLEDQRRFYADRCSEYAAAHRQASAVRDVLLVLAASAGFVGQLLDGTGRAGLSVVAAVLAALAAALTAFETLIGFEQHQKLFADAGASLTAALEQWDRTSPGGSDAAVDQVEQIFLAENGQWGQLVRNLATSDARPEDG